MQLGLSRVRKAREKSRSSRDVDSEKDRETKAMHRAHADSLAINLDLLLLPAPTEYLL